MRAKYFVFVLISMFLTSCFNGNLFHAMRISKNFPKEYKGLDTLIRIDGYYYREDSTGLHQPFFFLKNSEFKMYYVGRLKTHGSVQSIINSLEPSSGNYTLSGDTIKTTWVVPYALGHYKIYSEKFLIVNDTTLKRIWKYYEYATEKHGIETNEICHFHKYEFDTK